MDNVQKQPILKFVPDSMDGEDVFHLLRSMAIKGFEYNGSVLSVRGSYWLFSPIGWDAAIEDLQDETKDGDEKL